MAVDRIVIERAVNGYQVYLSNIKSTDPRPTPYVFEGTELMMAFIESELNKETCNQ